MGSIECGTRVKAQFCATGYEQVEFPRQDRMYICKEGEGKDYSIGANQLESSVSLYSGTGGIIIDHHPWVAKGPAYLELPRKVKASIIWHKVTESSEMGADYHHKFLTMDFLPVFYEWGDENDCRTKNVHS